MAETDIKKPFCSLCLNLADHNTFTIIENFTKDMLDMLAFKLSVDGETKIMCSICSSNLFAAFEFKSTCLYTNNTIKTYYDCETMLPLDIMDVYMNEMENKQLANVSDDQKVCRLCLQLIAGQFITVKEADLDMLLNFIPEINFHLTRDPLLCKMCYESLQTHAGFVKSCLNAQGKVYNKDEYKETQGDSFNRQFDLCLKNEVVEIETMEAQKEEEEDLTEHEELRIKCKNNYEHDGDSGTDHNKVQGNVGPHQPSHNDVSECLVLKCENCDYQTTCEKKFSYHQLKHKDVSDVRAKYRCDECNFRTKYRRSLTSHQHLKHRAPSELQVYKCAECDYETRYKGYIGKHQLKHKNQFKVQIFSCNLCDYRTKRKWNLEYHQLVHKDTSEVQMYECPKCDYKTKHKWTLKFHLLTHKQPSEAEMHKCGECDFETKYKKHLAYHRLRHRDKSEIQMYKCDKCDFQTKYKKNLTRHGVKHRRKWNGNENTGGLTMEPSLKIEEVKVESIVLPVGIN